MLYLAALLITQPVVARTADRPRGTASRAKVDAKKLPEADDRALVRFENSPFPYNGQVPEQAQPTPFLQKDDGDERFYHLAPRGGKLYAPVYADRRTLLHVSPQFDPRKPGAAILLFFHGNQATLARDVLRRQRVPMQVDASGQNLVLVAPQLARDALDSSPGHFYEPGFFDIYLDEAARHLAARSHGAFTAAAIENLPVVLVAYSGGYLATAFSLKYQAQTRSRIVAVILLDALFGEEPKFADWIGRTHAGTIFVSAYSNASRDLNERLIHALMDDGIPTVRFMPRTIGPGDVVFLSEPAAIHDDFLTSAGGRTNILQDLLAHLDFDRTVQNPECPSDAEECRTQPR